ncbi:MAG TPA: hypothetical protein VML50_17910 [Anaeromyxobacter sp.]|nr:hypothetical protein [Anaeromyxobacter sp.]
MRPAAALLLALAAPALAADPAAAPRRVARATPASPLENVVTPVDRPRGTGAVVYVTPSRAYLDAGAEDGLAAGQVLELRRSGLVVASCKVEELAPHHATCLGSGLKPGDTFRFQAAPEPPEPKLLPPPPPDAELARREAAVEAAPPAPLVDFQAPATRAATPRAHTAEVDAGFSSWYASTAGTSDMLSLDVSIHDAELGKGITLDVEARAEQWLQRYQPRFLPTQKTQLFVWQAQLTATPRDALILSAGRVLPWTIPGATIFDGAMAGFRGNLGSWKLEGGAFGGLVPQPDTTAPTTSRSTGGGYWVLDRSLEKGAWLRQEGRVAVVTSPELGTRIEGSLTARAFMKVMDLSGELHLGGGGKAHAQNDLDAARVDGTFRPLQGLSLGGSFRYAGLTWPQTFDPPAFPGHNRAADYFVFYDFGAVRAGATGGLAKDLGSALNRSWIGPELGFPRLFGWRGGLLIGYLEESGWIAGRSAYAQATVQAAQAVHLLARASWAYENDYGQDQHEVALLASATADLTRHLALRLSLTGRTGFDANGGQGSLPWGMTGFLTLVGTY